MNGPQPSTCCRGSQLGPVFLLTRLFNSHTFSSQYILFTHNFPKLSHTTLISSNVFTILWLFAIFFFFKKNLEHIRKSYVFFFLVSVNIVINLFVVVINLFVSILWLVYLLVYCDYLLVFFSKINIMINYKKCNHPQITHVMSKKLVISWNWFCSVHLFW